MKKICTFLVLTVDNGTLRRHAVVMTWLRSYEMVLCLIIVWDDSWQIVWDGNELTGFHWVHLGCGPWFGCCCYKSCCSATLTTFYAALQQCWIIGFWTVRVLLYFILFEFSNQRIVKWVIWFVRDATGCHFVIGSWQSVILWCDVVWCVIV